MKRCSSLAVREMQIKSKVRYYFTPARMAIIKKIDNNKCWQGCGEIGASYITGRIISYEAALGNSLMVSQKFQLKVSIWPVILLLRIYPIDMKHVHTKTYSWVFIVALFIIATN